MMQRCRVYGSDQGRRCSIKGSGQYSEVHVCSHCIKMANVQGGHHSMRVVKIGTWSFAGRVSLWEVSKVQRWSIQGVIQCREVNAGRCSIQGGQCNVVIGIQGGQQFMKMIKSEK